MVDEQPSWYKKTVWLKEISDKDFDTFMNEINMSILKPYKKGEHYPKKSSFTQTIPSSFRTIEIESKKINVCDMLFWYEMYGLKKEVYGDKEECLDTEPQTPATIEEAYTKMPNLCRD